MITKHTLSTYDRRFHELFESLLEMGERVKESLLLTKKVITARDEELYQQVRANDKLVNALNDKIEEQVNEAIALMNPMAVDLRLITSALKVSMALERSGDLAKSTARKLARLDIDVPAPVRPMLENLIDINIGMMDSAIDAVRTSNAQKAIEVWKRDDEADDQCREIFEILRQQMVGESTTAPMLVDIMFAAKNLERIADYATNLAKTVHYVITGEKPKKSLLLAQD